MQRKQFLKNLLTVPAYLFVSQQARALNYLESKQDWSNPIDNEIQNNLLNEPKREVLLAEIAQCVGLSGPAKTKCHQNS